MHALRTFGWRSPAHRRGGARLAASTGRRLGTPHSLYHGDYYRWDEPEGGELVLQENFTEVDGELTAPEFPDHPVLLHASLSDADAMERIAALQGADRLEDR